MSTLPGDGATSGPAREAIAVVLAGGPGDPAAAAWLELRADAQPPQVAGGLALAAGEAVLAATSATVDAPAGLPDSDRDELCAGGVTHAPIDPGRSWTLTLTGEDVALDVRLDAVTPPLELSLNAAPGRRWLRGRERDGGGEAFAVEHLCTFTGTCTVAGEARQVAGTASRTRLAGLAPAGSGARLRAATAWLDGGGAALFRALRPAGGAGQESEQAAAVLVEPEGDGEAAAPGPADGGLVTITDPRLSVTYDAHDLPRRAALELRSDDEGRPPWRAEGSRAATASLALGEDRLDLAFLSIRAAGRDGRGWVGVLRPR